MAKRLTMTYKDEVTTYDPIDVYNNSYSQINFQNVLKKLAHYEDLEEQGRLIELPCLPNEEVWESNKRFGTHKTIYASREAIVGAIEDGYAIGYTKESAEARLEERRKVMSRLTLKEAISHAKEVAEENYWHGMLCHANPNDEELDKCIECGKEHEQLAVWLTELQRYKNLKEQGRLIELPCDVGDTVWIIAPNYYKCNNRYNCEDYNPEEYLISWCQKNCSKGYQGIGTIQCVIYGVETYNNENSVQIDCLLDVNGNHYRYSIKDIFLTKEEAEAKLKELRGEQE